MLQFLQHSAWALVHPTTLHLVIVIAVIGSLFALVGAALTPTRSRIWLIETLMLTLLLLGTTSLLLVVRQLA
jgi:hypothetical protein